MRLIGVRILLFSHIIGTTNYNITQFPDFLTNPRVDGGLTLSWYSTISLFVNKYFIGTVFRNSHYVNLLKSFQSRYL